MEILIGLAVATAAVIGWFYGSLFVCVFLTLPVVATVLIAAVPGQPGNGSNAMAIGCWLAVMVIWGPRWWRLRRTSPY